LINYLPSPFTHAEHLVIISGLLLSCAFFFALSTYPMVSAGQHPPTQHRQSYCLLKSLDNLNLLFEQAIPYLSKLCISVLA